MLNCASFLMLRDVDLSRIRCKRGELFDSEANGGGEIFDGSLEGVVDVVDFVGHHVLIVGVDQLLHAEEDGVKSYSCRSHVAF